MGQDAEDRRIRIRLMNEYGVSMPLWGDDGLTDGKEWDLSASLLRDLEGFAARWEASVPAEVYDDRYDGVPVLRFLNDMRYAVQRLGNPAARRRRKTEDAEMQQLGEHLASRLQLELGRDYLVTYEH